MVTSEKGCPKRKDQLVQRSTYRLITASNHSLTPCPPPRQGGDMVCVADVNAKIFKYV